jgi:diguanylate cyclase (GGDEF)-like protein
LLPEAVLDVVAAILRALGENARPSTGATESLESWARHVLVLSPPPGVEAEVEPRDRDWAGLRRYTVGHIREEGGARTRTIVDLQDALWVMIDGFAQAISEDSAADERASVELDRLRIATQGPAEELKEAALATVQRVGQMIEEKRARQRDVARELGSRIDLLRLELEGARRDAELDGLTQLWNRSVFERELRRSLQIGALLEEPVCLVMVDLDSFKQVNDTFGHPAGDALLQAVSKALSLGFPRRSDIVARYGGDEFVIVLRDATEEDGERLANRFLATVREIVLDVPGESPPITASLGVAAPRVGDTPATWVERADRALYAAKQAGRNQVAVSVDEESRLAA